MWKNTSAFLTYKKLHNSYVSLANDSKIPIHGCGTIQININGYILRINDVYHVPNLHNNLYSVKQHKNYIRCSCSFGYDGDFLTFPNFKFSIDDQDDLIVYASDVSPSTNKIHWCSSDGKPIRVAKVSHQPPKPRRLPSQKPNPSKNHHRRLTTVDLHRYFGFRTLKTLSHFKVVALPNVTIIPAGDNPMEIGDVTTIHRTTSNKSPVPRPTAFFDAAHMDIAYGDVVAPGGIKFALIIVDRKTRYTYVLPLKNCQSQSIITALTQLKIMAGKLPTSLYTDFDSKLLSSSVLTFCAQHNTMIIAAPSEQQNQNCRRAYIPRTK